MFSSAGLSTVITTAGLSIIHRHKTTARTLHAAENNASAKLLCYQIYSSTLHGTCNTKVMVQLLGNTWTDKLYAWKWNMNVDKIDKIICLNTVMIVCTLNAKWYLHYPAQFFTSLVRIKHTQKTFRYNGHINKLFDDCLERQCVMQIFYLSWNSSTCAEHMYIGTSWQSRRPDSCHLCPLVRISIYSRLCIDFVSNRLRQTNVTKLGDS